MGQTLRGTEILIVEDNPADAWLLRELLSSSRVPTSIQVVTDGEAATDYLFRRGEHASAVRPQIVLLDLNLPKKEGIEVLREIKADATLSSIPVIVLSTSARSEDVQRSLDHRADSYFTKPGNLPEFEAFIERLTQVEFPRLIKPNP